MAKFDFSQGGTGLKGIAVAQVPQDIAKQDDVFIDDITLPAVDGYSLAATLFLPRGRKRSAVLINSATAVSRQTYRSFASYLARRGNAVLTYDYRGIGGSRRPSVTGLNAPRSLAGFDASMARWAAHDITAAVAWMRGRYRDLPLTYVGHSFGGQALGLLPNNAEVSRALLVCAQAACWKAMSARERYRFFVLLRIVGLPATRILGYMPGKLGFGEDLPKGVYEQWTQWMMSPRSMFDDTSLATLGNFANYAGALRALSFTDDTWAPRPTVEALCAEFKATKADVVSIAPVDIGATSIGHLGFFRPEHRDTLWRGAAEWLEFGLAEPRRYSAATSRV